MKLTTLCGVFLLGAFGAAGAAQAQDPAPDAPKAEEVKPPALAPFSGPAENRVLPPPAPLAGMDVPELPSDLEGAILREAVVTTGSKRAQKIQDVPLTISWIPAEELEGTGQFSLCDAIQYFPGLECRRGAMRKAAVSARGLGSNFLSNRLLLLKDGRPNTDPWTGIFYPDETTPLTNIKQIEVIRGPGSSLYGSGAFSGVINLIQRSPDDLIKEGNNFGADLRLLAGQHDTYRFESTLAGKAGDLKGLANYYGFKSDGAQLLNNATTGVVDNNEWSEIHQVSGKVEYKVLALDMEFNDGDIGRPGGQAISQVGACGRCHFTPQDREHVQNLSASAQVDARVNDWLRVFGQGYSFLKRREVTLRNEITEELQTSLGKRRRVGGELRALLSFGGLNMTVGGDVKDDIVNNQNVLPQFGAGSVDNEDGLLNQQIIGAFVDAEYRLLENLVIGGGVRYDQTTMDPTALWTTETSQVSPRASIVYHVIPQLTLRTNYGRAFRAPTLAELAINQQMYASTLLGNPNLAAETLDTVEVAVDVWPKDTVRLTGTGFYSVAKNFIDQTFQIGSTSRFENVGDARVSGLELEAAAQVRQINSSFDVAYQYLDAQAIGEGDARSPLDYAPSHRVYARGRTNFRNVAFTEVYGLYVGKRRDPSTFSDPDGGEPLHVELPSYFVSSARVGVNVVDGLKASLIGTNLFDTSYQEMHGFPMPKRSLFLELNYTY